MSRSWLIIGAGYTGGRLAARLAERGDSVTVTRRHFDTAGAGARWPSTVTELALDLDGELPPLSAGGGAAVVCAPPGESAGQREARLVAALRDCSRLIYVSSTGVYGPGGGQWVDERWPIAPHGALGEARAAAEASLVRAAESASISWCLLRAAGIYGPGRGLVARVRSGAARVIEDGRACVSRIHVEDLVTAIVHAAEREICGAVNCADDEPSPHGEVLDAVAAHLGLPPPPRVGAYELSDAARAMLLADRKIQNRRMRQELGVELRYPSWRDGLAAELATQQSTEQATGQA